MQIVLQMLFGAQLWRMGFSRKGRLASAMTLLPGGKLVQLWQTICQRFHKILFYEKRNQVDLVFFTHGGFPSRSSRRETEDKSKML